MDDRDTYIEKLSAELLNAQAELLDIETELAPLIKRRKVLLHSTRDLGQRIKDHQSALRNTSDSSNSLDWSSRSFPWTENVEKSLENVFKLNEFRKLQRETINATMSGRDCVLIMPTGAGKSICFQLPAVISHGFSLVISPLVSLIQDQLIGMKELDINATFLSASSTKPETKEVYAQMIVKKPTIKMLYVTPEKVAKSKMFMAKLEKAYEAGNLSRIVIDEVHCTSQWGHDFRPDFKILGILKRQFSKVPILGLTATATNKVLQDIKDILGLQQDCLVFKSSFNRPNLFYEVRTPSFSATAQIDELAEAIKVEFNQLSGIVYCFSRKDTEHVTCELVKRGVPAGCYHAELDVETKKKNHHKWIRNEIQVIVATIAFGMGIDKPNVRFVIHYSISKSIQNYYQESGRAGRDGNPAKCILFYKFADVFRQSSMVFTEQTGMDNLHAMLEYSINLNSCRRSLISHHFGETWDRESCNEMCDNCVRLCNNNVTLVTKDVSHDAMNLYKILDQAKRLNERLTPSKLVGAWMGKGKPNLRVTEIKPPNYTKDNCEKVIAKFILDGALIEDFHFTPYSTICYLVAGFKRNLVLQGKLGLSTDFEEQIMEGKNLKETASKEKFADGFQTKPDSKVGKKRKTLSKHKSHIDKKIRCHSNEFVGVEASKKTKSADKACDPRGQADTIGHLMISGDKNSSQQQYPTIDLT